MPTSDYPEEIDLSKNFLKAADIIPFINTLRPKMKSLNFMDNLMGYKGVTHFANFLYDNKLDFCHYLNLNNVKMGDKAGQLLLESISQMMKNLNTLILGKNELSTQTAIELSKMFEDENNLT